MSRMSTEIGRVLGRRYRIIAPIGMGASAQVFLADDVRLGRRVAVKMLHAALADDAEFLRRFQAEAQAVAALNHPNIVSVFDWGDDEQPFLVSEFLAGGSLRALLDTGRRLSPSQALGVGLEASRALDYAHRRGLVHRDIKPSNLLFGEEGRLRVADFGLARALAEAAWTEPQGAVLGTARYASPEQAQGEQLTAQSDIYSLALVLIEAVTGEVPFAADTTLGTLMARVARPLVVPDQLGPLAAVLARAGATNPGDRLDAHALGLALMAAAPELDKPAPLPLAGARSVTVDTEPEAAADPTLHMSSGDEAGDQGEGVEPGEGEDFTTAVPVAFIAPPPPPGGDGPDDSGYDDENEFYDEYGDYYEDDDVVYEEQPRRRTWLILLIVALLLGGALVGGLAVVGAAERGVKRVPSLAGLQVADAQGQVATNGWRLVEKHTRVDNTKPGQVLSTTPVAGTRMRRGKLLTFLVSDGPTLVELPGNIHDKPQASVEVLYKAIGMVTTVTTQFDEDVAPGRVVGFAPGTAMTLPRGSTVGLVVSNGPAPRNVPQGLVGLDYGTAASQLRDLKLKPVEVDQYNDDKKVKRGQVFNIDPAADTQVARDSDVKLFVSQGPTPVGIPSLQGQTLGQATSQLSQLGFYVASTTQFDDTIAKGQVIGTQPGASSTVQPGTTITVVVSNGPDLVVVPPVVGTTTPQQAAATLAAAGLTPGTVTGVATGLPASTSPPAGSSVKRGTVVNIVLG